jgi:hypothetical protein
MRLVLIETFLILAYQTVAARHDDSMFAYAGTASKLLEGSTTP